MSAENEKTVGLDAAEAHCANVYTTRDPFEIINDEREDPPEIWGGLMLASGQLMEVIGPSGLGKSRLMLNLAINQILGRDFAGLPVYDRPLTWLFFGNENSFYRYRYDLKKMMKLLGCEDKEKLRGKIWLPTVESPGDSYLSFADKDNIDKFKATIRVRKPDVIVLDPWGAIIDGDELSDQDVRSTLSALLNAINDVALGKPLPVIILNHSRNGANEMAKAYGPEAANFGKNSKAIFTVMRNVWNLRPGNEDGSIIELIHAKCSDRKSHGRKAVELNSEYLHYNEVPNFDHDSWQMALEKLANSKSALKPKERALINAKELDGNTEKIWHMFENHLGIMSNTEFLKWAATSDITEKLAGRIKNNLIAEGKLRHIMLNSTSEHYYGTPERVEAVLTACPGMYTQMDQKNNH